MLTTVRCHRHVHHVPLTATYCLLWNCTTSWCAQEHRSYLTVCNAVSEKYRVSFYLKIVPGQRETSGAVYLNVLSLQDCICSLYIYVLYIHYLNLFMRSTSSGVNTCLLSNTDFCNTNNRLSIPPTFLCVCVCVCVCVCTYVCM